MRDFLLDFHCNYMSLSCTVSEILHRSFPKFKKVTWPSPLEGEFVNPKANTSHMVIWRSMVTTAFEFCQGLWRQKTRVPVLSCSVVSMILHAYVSYFETIGLPTCDRQKDRRTDRHTTMANTALIPCGRTTVDRFFVHAACGRYWVFLWRCDDTLCSSGFTDTVIFSYHWTNGRMALDK